MKATLSPAKLASLKQRRLRTLRLHPPLYARPLRPFPESGAFSYDCRYRHLYNRRYRQSPKSRSGSTPGLSWRALSAVTVVSARSVCCLSEASFRRDSERRERSSEPGSALTFWLLLGQAKSNRTSWVKPNKKSLESKRTPQMTANEGNEASRQLKP